MPDRDWTVVRKGKEYCAPACGGGCTFAQYTVMKKQADKMCAELGKGWEPKLTHNLGWHCKVVNGHVTIHYFDDRSGNNHADEYSAWIEFDLGSQTVQIIHDDDNMQKAFSAALKEAKALRDLIKKQIDTLEL